VTRRAVVHDPQRDLWIVQGHREVSTVLTRWRQFSSDTLSHDNFPIHAPGSSAVLADAETLLASNPPLHTRLRRLLHLPGQDELAATVLPALRAAMARVRPAGRCEVIAELCQPVIASALAAVLGLRSRLEQVAGWLRVCSGCNAQSRPTWLRAAYEQMVGELWRSMFSERAPDGGLLLQLRTAAARGDIDGRQAVDLCLTLMKGAADTVGHAVGNSLCALQRDPQLARTLREQPEELPAFLEESLRLHSPVQMTMRRTTEAVELGGVPVPAGARVLVLLGAANQDPEAFEAPAACRLGRDRRRSVAFGAGPHRCPGAQAGQAIARAILRELLALEDLRVDLRSMVPAGVSALLGPRRLEVTFAAAAVAAGPASGAPGRDVGGVQGERLDVGPQVGGRPAHGD
jgi:cytochrome P450